MTYWEITLCSIDGDAELNVRFKDQTNAYLIQDYIRASHNNDEHSIAILMTKEDVVKRFVKIFGNGRQYKIPAVYTEDIDYFDDEFTEENYTEIAKETFN